MSIELHWIGLNFREWTFGRNRIKQHMAGQKLEDSLRGVKTTPYCVRESGPWTCIGPLEILHTKPAAKQPR